VVISGWRWLFYCWGVSWDGACRSRSASGDSLASSDVYDSDGASCCCVSLCVFPSYLCVSQCVFVIHQYLLDLFVKWGFKGCSCNICVFLGCCFVKFVSDYGYRGVLCPLSVSVMPYGFFRNGRSTCFLFKKKKKVFLVHKKMCQAKIDMLGKKT
jgi:hypothetical protein